MNVQKLKKYAFAGALALGFLAAPGLSSLSDVQAQGRMDRRDDRWDRRDDRRDNRRDDWRERQRARERAEWLRRNRGGNWGNNGGNWGNNGGYYGNNGGYGNNGYYNSEEQKGFRDGLDRGQEDMRDRRRFDPNNSSHYRKGNEAYRAGFRRGYAQGYRQRW